MNRTVSNRFALSALTRAARTLTLTAALAILSACAGGGPSTTVNQLSTPPTNSAADYTGPPPANADVQAFKLSFWQNVIPSNRCGGCHHAGGQSPQFARSDDVNLAYQAALPLVNLTNPSQSTFVLKVGGGHNCWVADPSACAATMLVWIQGWIGAGSSSTSTITLVAPPVQAAGGSKQFPASATAPPPSFQQTLWTPILTVYCSGCHSPSSATAQQPYFADKNDVNGSYLAAQPKINLSTPNQSRFYQRLSQDFHHCWPSASSGGAPDCTNSAAVMLAALNAFANGIQVTPIDPTLVVSNAVTLSQGTIAAGGSRYEANLVAKYMFETGQGSTAYDTSGVTPAADLTLSGNVTWAGGWGITLAQGAKAQASTSASQKLASMIQGSGEYTIETWVAPANVAQTNAYIVSYSGSNTTRNMTLGQAVTQYQGLARSSVTDTNGMPPLTTTTADGAAQAALQHVVLTYDPVNGQKIYVNGVDTGDADPSKGGTLANWDSTFALVLGNETTGQRQWQGTIKFAAIHNRALTPAQIQQNFAAGVGQKYFMLFGVSSLTGVSQSYILFQGSQYDTYSYLFAQPKFISLDPTATIPANLKLSGIRLGVNGQLVPSGQSYTTVSTTIGGSSYTAANGQLLSNLGTVVPLTLGPANDLFFLSFDQIGANVHPYVEPTVTVPAPVADNTPQPDIGVMTFERLAHTMAKITTVPFTNATVYALYNTQQQSMPSTALISAFVPSQQTAIGQLAGAYCGQVLANASSSRTTIFGNLLEGPGVLTQAASSFYYNNASNQQAVASALATAAVGSSVSPVTYTAAYNEVQALLQRVSAPNFESPAPTVSAATQAACTAVLGSAAVTLQ
jgi:hypothetical protein